MKTVEVKEQVRLPMSKCMELVLSGVRYRLFRAAITVVIVALAVAFLTTMLTESLVARNVAHAIEVRTAPRRNFLFWVGRLFMTMTRKELTEQLADAEIGPLRVAEFAQWGKLSEPEMERLRSCCAAELGYLSFLSSLTEADKVILLGRERGSAIFQALQDEERLAAFRGGLEQVNAKLPNSIEHFESFLSQWQAAAPLRERVLAGHAEARGKAKALLNGRQPMELLAEADDALRDRLAEFGYRITAKELEEVRYQASLSLDADRLARTLSLSTIKARLANRTGEKATDVNAKLLFTTVHSRSGARWLLGRMQELNKKLTEVDGVRQQADALKQKRAEILRGRGWIEAFDCSADRIGEAAGVIRRAGEAEPGSKRTAGPRWLIWVARLDDHAGESGLFRQLADDEGGSRAAGDIQAWGGLSNEETAKLQTIARTHRQYLRFFEEGLPAQTRTALFGGATGSAILDGLTDNPGAQVALRARIEQQQVKFPSSFEQFQGFLADRSACGPVQARVFDGHAAAWRDVRRLAARGPGEALFDGGWTEMAATSMARLGFRLYTTRLEAARRRAALHRDAEMILKALELSPIKNVLAGENNVPAAQATKAMLLTKIDAPKGATWLRQEIGRLKAQIKEVDDLAARLHKMEQEISSVLESRKTVEDFHCGLERIREVAGIRLDQTRLSDVEATAAEAATQEGAFGFSSRAIWLLVVSFIVCIVGITNAMLMSVTERFREIATMKCLGATDGFIMINFILESCMQGMSGGIVGAILGFLLGAVRAWGGYGWMALAHFPGVAVLTVAAMSLLVGVLISALAAMYPAWVAARLAPMEAMRIE